MKLTQIFRINKATFNGTLPTRVSDRHAWWVESCNWPIQVVTWAFNYSRDLEIWTGQVRDI